MSSGVADDLQSGEGSVKRYAYTQDLDGGLIEDSNGEWVLYEDYERLLADIKSVKEVYCDYGCECVGSVGEALGKLLNEPEVPAEEQQRLDEEFIKLFASRLDKT
jgi:hypothetical protein